MNVNAADYLKFPKNTVGKADNPVGARNMRPASAARERIPESDRFSSAGICRGVNGRISLLLFVAGEYLIWVGMRTSLDLKNPDQ